MTIAEASQAVSTFFSNAGVWLGDKCTSSPTVLPDVVPEEVPFSTVLDESKTGILGRLISDYGSTAGWTGVAVLGSVAVWEALTWAARHDYLGEDLREVAQDRYWSKRSQKKE